MTFALERHHLENHSACLQKDHALHTPEVQIELDREWTDLTYSFNESSNAWLDNVVSNVKHMSLRTLEVYTLLVADLCSLCVQVKLPSSSARPSTCCLEGPPRLTKFSVRFHS